MKNEKININIKKELKEEFREVCDKQDKKMSHVLRDFIFSFIKKNK